MKKKLTLTLSGVKGGTFNKTIEVDYQEKETDAQIEKRAKLQVLNQRIKNNFPWIKKDILELTEAMDRAGIACIIVK